MSKMSQTKCWVLAVFGLVVTIGLTINTANAAPKTEGPAGYVGWTDPTFPGTISGAV